MNILKNAEDILIEQENNRNIIIRTYIDNNNAVIEIEDNAGGIPNDIIDKIFDPYFSTKISKNGTGLGLYMSKTIINDHCGGELSAKNSDYGAIFTIKLPLE